MTAATAANWMLIKQQAMPEPPSAWELEIASDRARWVPPLLEQLNLSRLAEYRPESGAIDIQFDRLRDRLRRDDLGEPTPNAIDLMVEVTRALAVRLDADRAFYTWEDLNDEERAPGSFRRAVYHEVWAGINHREQVVHQVGPGGRLTVYATHLRSQIMIRRRTSLLRGAWRPPSEILETVNDLIGQEPASDARLRGAFGYFEASKLETQRYLRPVFVFVLDRAAAEQGPRWRVASVVAATTLEGLPLTAGLESAAGGCP